MFNKLSILIFAIFGFWWFLKPPELSSLTIKPAQTTNPPNPIFKDKIKLPTQMLCPHWAQMAVDVGWGEADLSKLDNIIYRESRCFTMVFNPEDPNGGSYGLTQINGYFCKPSKWYPNGYLQALGVLKNCNELFYPRTNLLSARLLWLYSERTQGNGWAPWQK